MAVPPGPGEEFGPAPDHGLSLLAPEADVVDFRRRREHPAEVGRYLLLGLGAVALGAGASLTWLRPAERLAGLAVVGFGFLLVALGAMVHLVLLRDRQRQPQEAHAWEDGIELVLANGEVLAVAWGDPRLALDLFVRPARASRPEERLLVWGMGRSIPPVDLSEAALGRLLQNVATHGLRLTEYRQGRHPVEPHAYEIRGRPADAAQTGSVTLSEGSRSVP